MAEQEPTFLDAQSTIDESDSRAEEEEDSLAQEEEDSCQQHAKRPSDDVLLELPVNIRRPVKFATDPGGSADEVCRRMRMGTAQAASAERLLVTARSRVGQARDALDEEGGPQAARGLLELADQSLRAAELQLSRERLDKGGGAFGSSSLPPRAFASSPSPYSSITQLDDDGQLTPSNALDMRTRKWLVDTFTDHDIDAADAHGHIMISPTYSPTRRMRRHQSFGMAEEAISKSLGEAPVKELLCRIGLLDFDALAFAKIVERPISVLAAFVFQESNTVKGLHAEGCLLDDYTFKQCLVKFFGRLDKLYYPEVVYHGAAHACDVMATTEWLLRTSYLSERTTLLDHFLLIVASAVHDVAHPGTTNLFQQTTMAPLALRYNDRSILENMHVATAFELMQEHRECNWFELLCHESSKAESAQNLQQYVRKGLIEMVLATDMAKHAKHVSDLVEFVSDELREEVTDRGPSWEEMGKQRALETKLFLGATVLHASDISNPCKPREVMVGWTKRILTEFWAQGDKERMLGLEVSPLCERESGQRAVPKGQIGFINFVVQPFFSPLVQLIPEVQEAIDCLDENKKFWQEQDRAKATFETIFANIS